jgi:hypothetical protein
MAGIGYQRIPFDNAGFYFLLLLLVVLAGFLPSYLPETFAKDIEFTTYTHIHATIMTAWLGMLIAQPFLIRQGQVEWHRRLGKVSFVLVPAIFVSVLLLAHSQLSAKSEIPIGPRFYLPVKDLIVIGTFYGLAMFYRRKPAYHARLMVATTFQLLEPALVRALNTFVPLPDPGLAMLATWITIDVCLIVLIWKDRNLRPGRWIFRAALAMTLSIQGFLIAGGPRTAWFTAFVEWFAALPLT